MIYCLYGYNQWAGEGLMGNWRKFIFNEPYTGKEIEKINDVILPLQYMNFMKKHNGGEGDIEEEYISVLGNDIDELPEKINELWR